MNTVHDIIKNSLCLGCGLCEALDKENCKMVINQEGFYEPVFRDQHRIDHESYYENMSRYRCSFTSY